jgi:hypothetical protein
MMPIMVAGFIRLQAPAAKYRSINEMRGGARVFSTGKIDLAEAWIYVVFNTGKEDDPAYEI